MKAWDVFMLNGKPFYHFTFDGLGFLQNTFTIYKEMANTNPTEK